MLKICQHAFHLSTYLYKIERTTEARSLTLLDFFIRYARIFCYTSAENLPPVLQSVCRVLLSLLTQCHPQLSVVTVSGRVADALTCAVVPSGFTIDVTRTAGRYFVSTCCSAAFINGIHHSMTSPCPCIEQEVALSIKYCYVMRAIRQHGFVNKIDAKQLSSKHVAAHSLALFL